MGLCFERREGNFIAKFCFIDVFDSLGTPFERFHLTWSDAAVTVFFVGMN